MKVANFPKDVQELLFLLSKYGVRYLIVGGEAVIYYGNPRLTGDIDFFYENDSKNVAKLFEALTEFWDSAIPGIENKEELFEDGVIVQFGLPPNRIDLINNIEAVSFEEAWENKLTETVNINSNLIPIFYIGLEELIINKQSIGRNKDQEDLKFLKAIQKSE